MTTIPTVTVSPTVASSPSVAVSPSITSSPLSGVGMTITSPAAGTEFPVLLPVTVSGTSIGIGDGTDTVEASWHSDFSVICGTGDTSSGTWSIPVVPLVADAGNPKTLYVRDVGGSAALASRSYIVPAWTGAIDLGWDVTRLTTSVSGYASEIQQFVGGTSADYLAQATPGDRPPLAASAKLNGRLSIKCTVAERMISANPTLAVSTSQVYTAVYAGVSCTGATAYDTLWDSASAAARSNMRTFGGNWNIYNGSGVDTGVSVDATQAVIIAETANGSSTIFRYYLADGTNDTVTSLAAGSHAIKGLTMFDYQAIGRAGVGAEMTIFTIHDSSFAAGDWAIWQAFAQTELGFAAPL